MARCCGGSTCACLIQGGAHIAVVGSGSAQDPFVLTADVDVEVADNSVFNMTITGAGTTGSPWVIETTFAATASINDLPDVSATGATNGQVLAWNAGLSRWEPQNPTPAAAGSVQHDTSLDGDGSIGTPLGVREDPAGLLATGAGGLGLSTAGKNSVNRKFADDTARSLATPSPDLNTLSTVQSRPGQLDYWTGTEWAQVKQFNVSAIGELLALSGGYAGGRLSLIVRQVSATTDGSGVFTALTSGDLTGYAGLLFATFQPTGSLPVGVSVSGGTTLTGTAFRLDDGTPYVGQNITGTVLALAYN